MTAAKTLGDGLSRVAMDLHLHTPASEDWVGDEPDAEDYVGQAISAGLGAIAITDHQTGDWVDRVAAAAKGTGLTVFPGVEINNLAGSKGIHLVALFDVDATSKDIDRFLAAIGAVGGAGKDRRRSTATKGILEVLHEIRNFNGIAVLAHCQSSKGVLGDMRGDIRKRVVQHPVVLAAEAPAEDFYDAEKAAKHERTYDYLDGTDPDYQCELAVFQSSDNPAGNGHGHSLAGIGSRFTYFYVEEPISLESLRQCFIDREVRIAYPPPDETGPTKETRVGFPRIAGLSVKGGFLDDLSVPLHPGLTTLIGAKGSGKSMLVELIRFALDQPPTQPEIRKDHETKLAQRLGLYGQVTLTVHDASGTEHQIVRTYDPANGSPYAETTVNVADFFPAHLLSQGEIVRLAESEQEQISFIDTFFDFRAHQRGINELRDTLGELDKQVAVQIRARKAVASLDLERNTLAERVDTIDKQLKSPIFGRYREAQKKDETIRNALRVFSELEEALAEAQGSASAVAVPEPPEELSDDPLVRRLLEQSRKAREALLGQYKAAGTDLAKEAAAATADRDSWLPDFKKLEDEYTATIKDRGDAAKLNQERTRLVKARAEVETKLRKARLQADQLRPTVEKRNATVEELRAREEAYTQARQERCEWFHEKSNGKIRASVDPGSNYEDFHARLEGMKRGSYLHGHEIEDIAKRVAPATFVRALLRYDLSRQPSDLDPIGQTAQLDSTVVVRLADFLLAENDYEHLLDLEYTVTPTDRPQISYLLPDGSYAPLDQLSTGQKCTVFLIMTLCEGEIPIIVDQPEDSLDIRSIWDDMCQRLRSSKRFRQFIFTTHNSSLSVASDSDKFVVLAADARRASVVLSGAIDSDDVRQDVIALLEGGEETYFLKQRKYNLELPSSN